MRAAIFPGDGTVAVVEQDRPQARGDLVVVQILVAPLCTEFKQRAGGGADDRLGHEAAGVVVDAGSSALVAAGDRVVVMPQFACGRCWLCQRGDHIHCPNQRDVLAESGSKHGTGTVAQYVIKPDWLLIKVPDGMPLEHAAMACCGFGPTFTAHHRIGTTALDTVVVSGCGAVGLGAVAQAITLGATVIALETQPYRTALATSLGATEVLDPRDERTRDRILDRTDGRGADAGIETSGAPTAAHYLARAVRVGGRLGIVAWTNELTLPNLVPAGLDVYGCWHWNHQRRLSRMWTMISDSADRIELMITHRFELDRVADAMDLQARGESGKIIIHPFGAEAVE